MKTLVLIVASILVAAQVFVPRRFAFVPLLITACHVPVILIVPPSFSVIRIVMSICLLRALFAGVLVSRSRHSLNRWMIGWACVLVITGLAHNKVDADPMIMRLGMIYDVVGTYLCARAYLKDHADILRFGKCLAVILAPLAVLMILEKLTGQNSYAALGATFPEVRQGHVRASGPFGHAILAGTAGATSIPLVLLLFEKHRVYSFIGALACCIIVFCSGSSGPALALLFALGGLLIWRWRWHVVRLRRGVVLALVVLHFVMNDPVWYLMARIDITGGSVSYHRAELVTQALNRIGDWWLVGTDYTRDWFPIGVPWSANHSDITNYYIKMGVLGGLPLMLTFIAIIIVAFRSLGARIGVLRAVKDPAEFTLWCVGAALSAHCLSFVSVAPYDQSYVFFFAVIGALPGLCGDARIVADKHPIWNREGTSVKIVEER